MQTEASILEIYIRAKGDRIFKRPCRFEIAIQYRFDTCQIQILSHRQFPTVVVRVKRNEQNVPVGDNANQFVVGRILSIKRGSAGYVLDRIEPHHDAFRHAFLWRFKQRKSRVGFMLLFGC